MKLAIGWALKILLMEYCELFAKEKRLAVRRSMSNISGYKIANKGKDIVMRVVHLREERAFLIRLYSCML